MTMKSTRALFFGLTLAAAMAAHAQYQWIDKDGRRVFSDRPPPADVPAKNLVTQPRLGQSATARPAVSAPPADASSSPSAAASRPAAAASAAGSGVDKALEEKKRKAEQAEADKKKADDARLGAARAENCKRAMNAKSTIDSGMRMARINSKGEREFLDDAQRAEEIQRANAIIASDCR